MTHATASTVIRCIVAFIILTGTLSAVFGVMGLFTLTASLALGTLLCILWVAAWIV